MRNQQWLNYILAAARQSQIGWIPVVFGATMSAAAPGWASQAYPAAVPTAPTDLAVQCEAVDHFCAAANLSVLYSAGGEIASTPCDDSDAACQTNKNDRMAAAGSRYKAVREWLRSQHKDPTFEWRVLKDDPAPSFSKINRFVDETLEMLRTDRCALEPEMCARANVYILADVDQVVRTHPACEKLSSGVDACRLEKQQLMAKVDRVSSDYASTILKTYGWLSYRQWGVATEDGFFLLVQHSDEREGLQQRALGELKSAVARGLASPRHLAYLEDRVRVHSKKMQLYGTQGQCRRVNGVAQWKVDPIENEPKLDERRSKAGLSPFADYQREATQSCSNL